MKATIRGNKFVKVLFLSILFIAIIASNVWATINPWDEYSSFMPLEIPTNERHLRGLWISTTINLDWPSKSTSLLVDDNIRIDKSKDEFTSILDKAVEMNMNAVFLQVSPEGDAFYHSNIVPWSRYLTGTFGKDPGFDPLAFAIEEAHKRNLEFHAWINPYRVSMYTNEDTIKSLNIDKSVFKEYPNWIRTAKSRFVIDPGIPEARKWVVDRVMEVVNRYDIDGIHFDDYFYYEDYVGQLEDQETFEKYNYGQFNNLGDWRRNNTYLLVKDLSQKIQASKPWVKFGVSPTGVWANKKDGHPTGSNTRAGLPNYDRSFADTKKWVEEEIIDYIAPQIYFSFTNPSAPYGEVASWWSRLMKNKNVHLYIGQALYKANDDVDQAFNDNNGKDEFERQLKFNMAKADVMGSIMFRARNLDDIKKSSVIDLIKNDLWPSKALIPSMPWKGGKAPSKPSWAKIEEVDRGVKLSWMDGGGNTAYYGIYRIDKKGKKLVATIRKAPSSIQEFIDDSVSSNPREIEYQVIALDRLHNASEALTLSLNGSRYFQDIGRQYFWAVKAIDNLHKKGIVKGVGNGDFSPASNVSRADFLIMVMKSYGIELDDHIRDNFADAGHRYYSQYLATAKGLGLVSGVGDNLFLPEEAISRQDMMVILYSVLEKLQSLPSKSSVEKTFNQYMDWAHVAPYAIEAVKLFVESGIIKGDGENIRPRDYTSRAETAQVLYKLLEN